MNPVPWRPATAAAMLAVLGAALAAHDEAVPAVVRLACDVVYMPARSTWTRTVDIQHDDRCERLD
jgi:hypothetical protein